MSWLVANWIGVVALFCAPALVGILGWIIVVHARRDAERFARERAQRRHMPLSLTRPARH